MIEIYYRVKRTSDNCIEAECFDVDTVKEAKVIFNKTTNKKKEFTIVEVKKHK